MGRALSLLVSLMAAATLSASAASAQSRCSDKNISATGTPAFFYFTGKRADRNAWSAKVRGELGEVYAGWGRVKEGRIECVRDGGRFLCSASGSPCRAFGGA